jgi:hypothetical protein
MEKKIDEERGRRVCWDGLTWEKCRLLKVLLDVNDVHPFKMLAVKDSVGWFVGRSDSSVP